MLHLPSDVALILTASLMAFAFLDGVTSRIPSRARVRVWVPFALMTALGTASSVFAVLNPLLIAAAFGQI
jgi:hypothetical protein